MSIPPLQSATATAVIEQFPLRHRRVCPENIQALATSLLDLGGGYEAALRTVISMQRNLERIRLCDEMSPEAALLLEEMARQLQGLADAGGVMSNRLQIAERHLQSIEGPSAAGPHAESS